jgi:hypothetical protein
MATASSILLIVSFTFGGVILLANAEIVIVMEDTTETTGQSLWSGRPVHAEYVTPTSILVGKQIDSITVTLKEMGTAPGTVEVGVINTDLSMKKLFGTKSASTVASSYTEYEFILSDGSTYTIEAGDRIGVKYTAGSSSNRLSIMRDTTGSFDGTSTYHTTYTTGWNTYTSVDLTMTLKSSGDSNPPTVTATPAGGSYNTPQLVTLAADEPATIYYTLDGSQPDTSSSVYAGSPLDVSSDTTLKFFGVDTAGNLGLVQTETYTFDTTPPTVTASPAGGSYTSVQSVELSSSESGTTIYYTTNGEEPTESSSVYTSPIELSTDTVLKFFGKDAAGNSGSVGTETYLITLPDTTPPTITALPAGGTFGPSGTSVELTADEPAIIYYTTDGSTPDTSSSEYSFAIQISATATLKFFGIDTAGNPSNVVTEEYTIDDVPPTITALPAGGTYTSSQSVELSSSEPGTTIYYTTDGTEPGLSSLQYASPISISTDTTLQFYGIDSYGNTGSIITEIYDINAPSQPPGIVMEETTTTTGQSVWSGRPVHAEFVGPSSALVGKYIDSISISLKKVGSTPPGTAQVGIINPDLSMKKVFATISPSTLPTSYTSAEYALAPGDYYLIEAGDRIGVKYTAGTSSTYIAIMRDTTGGFDGANTYHTTFTSGWNTYTSVDLTMTLKYSGAGGGSDTTPPSVSVTHSPTSPSPSSIVSFTAVATDNFGLSSIEIFVDGSSLGSCPVSGTSADCMKSGGPYGSGSSHTYYAEAYDSSGLPATSSTGNFVVSSSSPPSGSLPTAEEVFNTEAFTVPHQVSHFIIVNPTHGHHGGSDAWIAPTNALYLPENLIISQSTAVTLLVWDDHAIHQMQATRADNDAVEWTTPAMADKGYSSPHTFSAATLYNIQDIYDAPGYTYDQSHIKGTITTQTPAATVDGTIVGAMYIPQSFDRSLITSKGFTIESEYDFYKVWKHLPYDNTLVIYSTQQSLSATMLDLQAIIAEVGYD